MNDYIYNFTIIKKNINYQTTMNLLLHKLTNKTMFIT